jgi:hypothetical protein
MDRPMLLLLIACAPPPPTLDAVAAALADHAPRAEADGLRLAVPDAAWTVRAALYDDPPTLRLSTVDLFRLDADADPAVTLRALTLVATLDHSLPLGRLSLDATTGEVVLAADLLLTDGLRPATVRAAHAELLTEARAVQPRLTAGR